MSRDYLLSVIVVGLVLSSCKGPDKIQVQPTTTSYIMVYNRGNYSTYERRRIVNRDTINHICRLLNQAKHVSLDTVNVKVASRFARFDIYDIEGKRTAEFSYDITREDGNIVWYRGSWFRSDSLDLYLK